MQWHVSNHKFSVLVHENCFHLWYFSKGVQYLSSRPAATRLLWFFLVLLALAGATIFAWNVFSDWQDERTITSLKTISKSIDQLDFPSVTICKGGQNLQAVKEVLEREAEEWERGRREKRSPSVSSGSNYCQHIFHRTCDEVFYQDLIKIFFRLEIG